MIVPEPKADPGTGVSVFALSMITLAGVIQVMEGVVAIFRSTYYTPNATYVFSDVRTWGWIQLIIGLILLAAAVGIFTSRQWGRWLGIGMAILSVLGQLFFVNASPWWSLVVIVIDTIIIYALTRYGVETID